MPDFISRRQLLENFDKHFSDDDVRDFCFLLHVEYENLPVLGKNNKARELLLQLERESRVNQLVKLGREKKPDANWKYDYGSVIAQIAESTSNIQEKQQQYSQIVLEIDELKVELLESEIPPELVQASKIIQARLSELKKESIPLIPPFPGGMMDADNPYYVRRNADSVLEDEILGRNNKILFIRADQGLGKSSLINRGRQFAEENGIRTAYIDFDPIRDIDYETFFRALATEVYREIIDPDNAEEQVSNYWNILTSGTATVHESYSYRLFIRFLKEKIIKIITSPLLLVFDTVNHILLDSKDVELFNNLINRLFNAFQLDNGFKHGLQIIIAFAPLTPYLQLDIKSLKKLSLLKGRVIPIQDFNLEQLNILNDLFEGPLVKSEVKELMAEIGGHPRLAYSAIYHIKGRGLKPWKDILLKIEEEDSPFFEHLYYRYCVIQESPEILKAVTQILNGQKPERFVILRLLRAGLIRQDGNEYSLRYPIYDKFFRQQMGIA